MPIHGFVVAAGFLLGQVAAITPAASSPVASSQAYVPSVSCRTQLGTSSLALVPTTTITRTIHDPTPVVVFATTQDTVTVTPDASTVTITNYETTTAVSTAYTVTDVFSTTSTEYDTATVTIIPAAVTAIVPITISTTSTSTSTVASSSGFSPIAETLPTATAAKRSLTEQDDCSSWLDDYEYPQEVECHQKIIVKTTTVSTVTEPPATATAVTPISTVTVTSTITSTSILVPSDVSTTLSYSTTSTITETTFAVAETTTVFSTTTAVAAVATATFYEACGSSNIAGDPLSSEFGSFAGQYMYLIAFTKVPGESLTVGDTSSAYDCCVSCMESSTCAMSYYNAVSSSIKYCYLIHSTTCSQSSVYAKASTHDTSATIQMSNGNCGRVVGVQG